MKILVVLFSLGLFSFSSAAQWIGSGGVLHPATVSDLVSIGTNNPDGNQFRVFSSLSSFKAGLFVDKDGNSFPQKNIAIFSGKASNPSNVDGNACIGVWQRTNQNGNYAALNFFNAPGQLSGFFGVRFVDGSNTQLVFSNRQGGPVTPALLVHQTGSVAIGTDLSANPNNYKLAVNGSIGSKEVMIETSSSTWPDYVFSADYDLQSLENVENFISENGHLPKVPSASEIDDSGAFRVGELNMLLLEKIEELTLHLIDLNKRIKSLESENESLKSNNK